MSFNIGDTVGDYQIIGILGAGGMGKVYKVRNVISDRIEAMKILLPNLAGESELADRFVREIKLLASLTHPNIAALHTALRVENQLVMIMEFVEGTSLETRLLQGPQPVPEAVDSISQVLSALSYAHERGVIHRDIKPANMMLTTGGVVKLMDFGIAKAAADRRLTMTGTTMGSLYYMSPEQVKGSADLDGRADLYSVGVSLYELVTGTRPFKGDSDYAIMAAHLEQEPVPPIQVDPKLPAVLNDVILMAIQKDRAKRFQSAQAFRAALQSVKGAAAPPAPVKAPVGPPPVQPRPAPVPIPEAAAPLPPQPARPGSRRGLWMTIGAVAALAVIVIAASQMPRWFRTKAGETASPTTQQTPGQAATPATETRGQPPAAAAGSGTAQLPPAGQSAGTPAAQTQTPPPATAASGRPARREATPATRPPAQTSLAPGSQPAGTGQPVAPPVQAQQPPESRPPAADAETRAALQQLRERMIFLASRANALRSSLQNLEQQQRASGLSMRTDISASWKRMEFLLDEAEAALKAGDVPGARRNLDLAEREADRLDQFLGR
jgi:serine/threonine-protein kinase